MVLQNVPSRVGGTFTKSPGCSRAPTFCKMHGNRILQNALLLSCGKSGTLPHSWLTCKYKTYYFWDTSVLYVFLLQITPRDFFDGKIPPWILVNYISMLHSFRGTPIWVLARSFPRSASTFSFWSGCHRVRSHRRCGGHLPLHLCSSLATMTTGLDQHHNIFSQIFGYV